MRLIYLVITIALVWLLVDTYLDRTAKPDTAQRGPMERAGLVDTGPETSAADPFFGREMDKARSVEKKLQEDVNRKLEELDKRLQQ